MQRILLGLGTIAVLGGLVAGGSGAFFSDTETSTGNTFTAGDIDLQIDNESYAIDFNIPGFVGTPTGALVANPANSWEMADLVSGVQKFFNFTDVKPGDYGEDTISIHVGSNDAWMCAAANLTDDSDQTCTEPEMADDPTCTTPGLGQGELDDIINFAFWVDDGDNVFESTGEGAETVFLGGPLSNLDNAGQIRLADSSGSILGGNTPIPGDTTFYIGKIWCAGTLTPVALAQDGLTTGSPVTLGTGWTCDGALINNAAQTDNVEGDMQFYAVQARNNATFTCAEDYTPIWEEEEVVVRPAIGAALASYVAPVATCDAFVDDSFVSPVAPNFNTIQAAIDDVTTENGETICVAAGSYGEDVTITKEVELAGAGAATTFVIGQTSGEAGAMVIAANNVTVRGFDIIDATGGIAALRISGARSGILVNSNRLSSVTGGTNAFLTDGGQTNVTVSNNVLNGNGAGQIAYVNGTASVALASTNVDFFENDFTGTIVAGGLALGNEATASDITENDFSSTITSTYAILENFVNDANVNYNNFNGVGGIKVRDGDAGAGLLDAENNWWGAAVPAGHIAGDVDDAPKEASALPLN